MLLDLGSASQRPPRPAGGEPSARDQGLVCLLSTLSVCFTVCSFGLSGTLASTCLKGLDSGSLCLCLVV